MAFDVEAAKQDGYTDEEIQHFLNTKEIPEEKPLNRGEEAMGTMQASLPQGAIYAGEGAALGYGGKVLKDVLQNRGGARPVAPTSIPSAPTVNPATSPSWTAPQSATQAPSMLERGGQYAREMQRIAAEKVMQGARAAAPYAAPVANAARAMAPAAAGIVGAVTPGNIGQNYPVPQSGPMRGMEINPNTGRPWTPQELATMR